MLIIKTYRFVKHAGNFILIAELPLTQLQDVLDAHWEGQQEEDVGSRHQNQVLNHLGAEDSQL